MGPPFVQHACLSTDSQLHQRGNSSAADFVLIPQQRLRYQQGWVLQWVVSSDCKPDQPRFGL